MGDTLTEGQKLAKGGSLTSHNGEYTLTLQEDGNLVLAEHGKAVWATGTDGQHVAHAEMQRDGNFVLYKSDKSIFTSDKPVWATDTKGKKHVKLVLQDDRNLVLYAEDRPVWSSKTDIKPPAPPSQAETPDVAPTAVSETAPRAAAREINVAASEEPVPPPPPPAARTYTVASGDTLWAIAERFYGDGSQYPRIAQASGISNPDLIFPGQVLTIP